MHHYADVGLTFVKLGEEARVDLTSFTLEGGHGKKFRQALHRLERERAMFRIVPRGEVAGVMDQLQAVSDDWLAGRAVAEKGFSLGYFDREYIARFPVAVVEQEGRIVAFANVWEGPELVELSVDLMRYDRRAPKDVMDSLFIHLMLWGKEQGYRWFPLGMAPLSGFEISPVAPLWTRLGVIRLRARRGGLQLPGSESIQGGVRPRVAAALPRLSRRSPARAHTGRRRRAHRRRLPADTAQVTGNVSTSIDSANS